MNDFSCTSSTKLREREAFDYVLQYSISVHATIVHVYYNRAKTNYRNYFMYQNEPLIGKEYSLLRVLPDEFLL